MSGDGVCALADSPSADDAAHVLLGHEHRVPGIEQVAHHHGFHFGALAQPLDQGRAVIQCGAATTGLADKAASGPAAKFQPTGLNDLGEQGFNKGLFLDAGFDLGLVGKTKFLKLFDVQLLAKSTAALFGHGGTGEDERRDRF